MYFLLSIVKVSSIYIFKYINLLDSKILHFNKNKKKIIKKMSRNY